MPSLNNRKRRAPSAREANGGRERDAHGDRGRTPPQGFVFGRNPVTELIKSGRPIVKVFLQNPVSDAPLRQIEYISKERGIPVARVDKAWLDRALPGHHQGAAALASVKEYADIADILALAAERGESPLVVVANEIHDPRNLGAIIRSAEAAGAHGVVVPKRNAAGLTDAVSKASAGAVEHLPVARAPNISQVLRDLKKSGLWIIGADASGDKPYTECDMTGASAIVIGGEHEGLGRLVRETCDYTISLPMRGKTASLNASAATAVILYEALRQRSK